MTTKKLIPIFVFFCLLWPATGYVASNGGYVLGPGDKVKITVYDHQDLTTEARISEKGTITFPLLGEVTTAGVTPSTVENKLSQALKSGGFVKQPQINVIVQEYRSQQVSVLGQISKPGKYSLDEASSVADLIALAGGVTPVGADNATLIRESQGKSDRLDIDLVALFHQGDKSQDLQVQAGDVIFVPRAPQFYIYGEVHKPGAYRLERSMTVAQAISVGGGITPRGTERGIKIKRRTGNNQEQTVRASLMDTLKPDDVVYVKESLF